MFHACAEPIRMVLDCFQRDDNFVVWSISRDLVERLPSEIWENKQGYLSTWFPNATSHSARKQISLAQVRIRVQVNESRIET